MHPAASSFPTPSSQALSASASAPTPRFLRRSKSPNYVYPFLVIVIACILSTTAAHSSISTSATSPTSASATSSEDSTLGPLNNADIVMILLTLSVVLRVLNFHFFKIPSSIAMAFGAILMTASLLVLSYIPWLGVATAIEALRGLLKDFPDLLLKYMLGFLLFAAAIEVDLRNLGRILSTVLALSVVSTLLSTLIVGVLTYFLMQNIAHMDFAWCLLFGAIVSPTDPVTVISILNDKPDLLPSSTKYFVIGESLLNDAVGVVLYLVLLEIVQKPDIGGMEIATLLFETVFVECVYGAVIGVFLAWIAYSAIVSVHEPLLEVVITFVLVGNINMICRILNASIPLASVGAGLFIGNYAVSFAMNEETTESFHEMWKLADETLNSILFLMIGSADLFWNPQDLGWGRVLTLVVCTICISIAARFVAVALPLLTIILVEWLTGRRLRHLSVRYRGGTIAVLTWAGMRGGISIALALGVPDSFVKHAVPGHMTYGQLIFFMTFILVAFSILVQGMLFEPVVKMINRVSFDIFASGGLGTYVSSTSLGNGYNESIGYEDEQSPSGSFIGEGHIWDSGGQQLYEDYAADESAVGVGVGVDDVDIPAAQDGPIYGGTVDENIGVHSSHVSIGAISDIGVGGAGTSDGNNGGEQPTVSIALPPRPVIRPGSIIRGGSDLNRRASEMTFAQTNRLRERDIGIYGSGTSPHVGVVGPMMGGPHDYASRRQGSITFENLPTLKEPPSVSSFWEDLRRGAYKLPRLFDKSSMRDGGDNNVNNESHPLRRSRTEPDNVRLARGEKAGSEAESSGRSRRLRSSRGSRRRNNLGNGEGSVSFGPVDYGSGGGGGGDSSDGGFMSGTQSAGEGVVLGREVGRNHSSVQSESMCMYRNISITIWLL